MSIYESHEILTRVRNGLRWRAVRLLNNNVLRKTALQVARQSPLPHGKPVAFFNASTRLGSMSLNAAYSLLVSWSLRLSGIPVVHFVCNAGMTHCIHGTNKNQPGQKPPCRECIAQSKTNYTGADACYFDFEPDSEFERKINTLSLTELETFTHADLPLGTICRSSLRWVMRRYHLHDDSATQTLFREYLRSAWNVARQFEHFLDQHQPRAVVVFNGIVYPEAIARLLAERRGIRVISHEVNMQPFSAYFTDREATFRSTRLPADFKLTPMEQQRFDEYFSKRTKGQFKMAGVTFWKDIQQLDPSFLQKAAQFRQIVPIFTNVIFDTSQEHANVHFKHMFHWLDDAMEIAVSHPDTLFVLRAHPDESRPGKASEESVADWVTQTGFDRLPNTLFIGPDQPLNSYELIVRSKFTLIYTSTIGMESTLLGTPVLCAGRAYFNEYAPATHFPDSPEEYQRLLESFLDSKEPIPVPAQQQENARNFLYSQLYLSALPFGDWLEEDGAWLGYVKLKNFPLDALLPIHSPTMQVIQNGILQGKPFLLERDQVH